MTVTHPPARPGRQAPPTPQPPPAPPGELTSAQWSMTVTPVVAAVTTLCTSLALSGVIDGLRWWGYAGVAVTVITAVGLGLRAVRTPILLVGLAQLFALLCLLVALFTDSGVLGLLPGPTAIGDLGDVLRNSVEVVRTGVPPVDATTAVLCLVVIAIGLVAILVDTLAVSAGTPAACGLVLLCVYAVPASLADEMLPWWAFILGAVSFAALLAVDGAHRHQQWRNRPTVQGTGTGFGSPVALVSGAVAIALFAGATVTAIGTVGQLPGGSGGSGSSGLGLSPFTQLRGMLNQGDNVELFRVRNFKENGGYLRALTLPNYDANGGWRPAKTRPRGFSVNRPLPMPPGRQNFGPVDTVSIEIEPINSNDYWAPVFGTPRLMRDLPADMRYDAVAGMIYGDRRRTLPAYVEEADLSQPTRQQLRSARPLTQGDVPAPYLRHDGIKPKVMRLANRLTAGHATMFDQAMAIRDYFDPTNGFTYSTETAGGSDESALEDFLFTSKTGFCEQYASAMAILLRAAGIPSRVAMGYTAGFQNGGYRSITTQNAHAWVEVFFPDYGWMQFDPTPLSDGTSFTPPYVEDDGASGTKDDPAEDPRHSSAAAPPVAPTNGSADQQDDPTAEGGADGPRDGSPNWLWWTILALVALAILATVPAWMSASAAAARTRTAGSRSARRLLTPLAVVAWILVVLFLAATVSWWLSALVVVLLATVLPGVVREQRRLRRRHVVHANGPAAATSAWAELLAESSDRGAEVRNTETVRGTARRLATVHDLDEDGKQALRTVVGEVERSWYGGSTRPDPALGQAFDRLMAGLRRTNPIAWRARLLPRSIMRGRRRH